MERTRGSARVERRWLRAAVVAFVCLAAGAHAELRVAVASNLQYAFEEIRQDFTRETGTEIVAVYGASGKLRSQILAGAPFDVFVSADVEEVQHLVQEGMAVGKPQTYAYGRLVLWTMGSIPVERGLGSLLDPALVHLALGDLKSTSYGPAALGALERAGVLEKVKSKFVYGNNVGQVAQFVASGAVQAGFVSKGQLVGGGMAGKGRWWEVPTELAGPIPQAMAMTRFGADHHPESARALMDRLLSEQGRSRLLRHGYDLP